MTGLNHLHGRIINYTGPASLNCIGTRNGLLDKSQVQRIDDIIDACDNTNPLLFLPNTIKEYHEKEDNVLKYKILMIGILPDGRKSAVILEGFSPYFEVRKPDSMEYNTFRKKVQGILSEKYRGSMATVIKKNGFEKYEPELTTYIRCEFNTLWQRKDAKKYFIETLGWKTTTDDNTHIERVACRDNPYSMCAWNVIGKYRSYKREDICRADKTFRVNIKDFVEYGGDVSADHQLSHDKTLVATWDIEAYSSTGEMPDPEIKDDRVFAIGKTYHWKDNKDSLLDTCFISRPCDAHADKLTIFCKSEKDLIKASFVIDNMLRPDFCIGFNDGDFDWPFVFKKAVMHKCLVYIKDQLTMFNDYRVEKMSRREQVENILSWDCRKQRIKLEADSVAYSTTLTLPGYINIDVRAMFRKLYPTETKSSLKFYLEISNLGGKEDMPIHYMFNIYRESLKIENDITTALDQKDTGALVDIEKRRKENTKLMSDVAHYCTIDAKRCQELMQKVSIIADKREVSNVSHTSLYDAIYFADGMKVRNLVIAEARERNLLLSTQPKPYIGDGKYPGAYVFPPIKGPVKPKLTVRELKSTQDEWKEIPDEDLVEMERCMSDNWVGANYSNEHKSLVCDSKCAVDAMAYITRNAKFSHEKSKRLFDEFATKRNKYPISGLDFSSLYPSLIMTYNLSPEYMVFTQEDANEYERQGHTMHKIEFEFNGQPIVAWSIRHDTLDGITLKPGKTKNKFGLYPSILKKLFDKRSEMKKILKKYAKQKEQMEKDALQDTTGYATVCFQYNYINSKQKALKVFMNTFYGETGNKLSPFFVLPIAGGITSAGQRNIKMVAELVQKEDCVLYYGDTDSCYISCPDKFFVELDARYYGGKIPKEEYSTLLVRETFTQIECMKRLANAHLINDNGTHFLKLAYEEVLFPALFLMKKMYAGVEHQSIVNFSPHVDELFTKGLSLKKRGTSEVLKTVCKEVLMEILDIHSIDEIMSIVTRKVAEIYKRNWGMSDFTKTAVFKPSKQNISVRTFYARMEERGDPMCPVPAPGERFEYVVVKKFPFKYDVRGRKTRLKIGEMWEYYTYAVEKSLEIDLNYYMTGGIVGQFAQLIAYMSKFQVIPDNNSQDAYDSAERKSLNAAKKHVESMCHALAHVPRCHGTVLKEVYKIADKVYATVASSATVNSKILSYDYSGGNMFDFLKTQLTPSTDKKACIYADMFVTNMCKKYGKDIVFQLYKAYTSKTNSMLQTRSIYISRVEDKIRNTLATKSKTFRRLFEDRDIIIEDMMKIIKNKLDLDNLESMSWGKESKVHDHTKFKTNPEIVSMLEGKNCDQFHQSMAHQKDDVAELNEICEILSATMYYMANTNAIINCLQFHIDKREHANPLPPGVTERNELASCTEFIKKNIIDF
jgi:DNA polymerase elongation subunit (family B)